MAPKRPADRNPGISRPNDRVWAAARCQEQLFGSAQESRESSADESGESGVAGGGTRPASTRLISDVARCLSTNSSTTPGGSTSKENARQAEPKGDYNINSATITFRYNQLDSSSDVPQNGSGALGTSRQTNTTQFLSFANSNYSILENLKSGVGEWNSVFGTMTNNLLIGYTKQDESRAQINLFPFVVIGSGDGSPLTSFGSEPSPPRSTSPWLSPAASIRRRSSSFMAAPA